MSQSDSQLTVKSQDQKLQDKLENSINKFLIWLENHGYASYDPYDIWGLPYSLWARKIYYKKSLVGLPFIAPILFIDTFMPALRCVLVKKERFATADAQLILAFVNLYRFFEDDKYLTKAEALGEELLSYSIPGYSGYCWGYPFDWQNSGALWRKDTPYITATPYCFEAYLALFDCTGNKRYLEIAESITRFVAEDLKETPTGENAAAGSYSPIDNSKVINASAYRAMVLTEASVRFNNPEWKEKADRTINFILQTQQNDGSWLYEMIDEGKKSFIDHFHTCFVLKNLYKVNKHKNDQNVKTAITRGFEYYYKSLFRTDGTPKPFAIEPRFQIVTDDLYNYGEAITLCSLLHQDIPSAGPIAQILATQIIEQYQTRKGCFITKVYRGGIKTKFPFLRWSQAQNFYGLTNLLASMNVKNEDLKCIK